MLQRNDSVSHKFIQGLCQLTASLLMLVGLALAAPAAAQLSAATHISATLDAETISPAPGTTVDIAIEMSPQSPWHGYWKNGGDAGFGMQVTWTLPRGVTIGELRYPVPSTLVISGLINHVYEEPYALIAPLSIAADVAPGTRLTIRGDANWLACTDEICVPESGILALDLTVGDGAQSGYDTSFDNLRRALPPILSSNATYEVNGDTLRIAIPLPASLALDQLHLFVETARINQPGAAQRFSRKGDLVIVETTSGADAAVAGEFAALLRIGGGRGLRFTAVPGPVPPAGAPIALVPAASAGGIARDTAPSMSLDDADARPRDSSFDFGLFLSALFGAIIGGLILNIMPCVFPILSLKALTLARTGGDERSVRAEGFAYTMGAILMCVALGVILLLLRAGGEQLGWAFQLQRPESVMLLIVLVSAIAANLAGLFEFGSINFARGAAATRGVQPLAHGLGEGQTKNAFATGALAAFIATPCTGPFLGAALGATLTLPPWAAVPQNGCWPGNQI